MRLLLLAGDYSVCLLDPEQHVPAWASGDDFFSITHAEDELSIVCPTAWVPDDIQSEPGWKGLKVEGPLAFDLIGILSGLLLPLAEAQIPVFVLSTYQTDYIFLQEEYLPRAISCLESDGHQLTGSSATR